MNKILFYSLLLINSNFNTQNSLHTSDSQIENKYDWSFKNKKNLILLSAGIVILIILIRQLYKIKKKREEKRREREKDITGYKILSEICSSDNISITITNYHEILNNIYDYENNANGTYSFLANLFYNNNKDKFNKTSEITESILKILNSKNKINIEGIEGIEKIEDIRKKLIEAIYNKFITEGKPRLFEIIKYNDTYIFKNKIESNEEQKMRRTKNEMREKLIKIANQSNIEEPKKPIKIEKKESENIKEDLIDIDMINEKTKKIDSEENNIIMFLDSFSEKKINCKEKKIYDTLDNFINEIKKVLSKDTKSLQNRDALIPIEIQKKSSNINAYSNFLDNILPDCISKSMQNYEFESFQLWIQKNESTDNIRIFKKALNKYLKTYNKNIN